MAGSLPFFSADETDRSTSALKKLQVELDQLRIKSAKAADAAVKSEIDQAITTQKLINNGTFNKAQAEQLKAVATRDRLNKELAFAKDQAIKLGAIRTPDDDEAAQKLSNQKETTRREVLALTLRSLQAEGTVQDKAKVAMKQSLNDQAKLATATKARLRSQLDSVSRLSQVSGDKIQQAEAERMVDIQKLINSGTINQVQSEKLKSNATRDRVKKELELSQQNSSRLNALPIPGDPDAANALEDKKRSAKKQTTDLTLRLLQAEALAQERVRLAVIQGIDDQLAVKTRAYDQELAALNVSNQVRLRSSQLIEASSKSELATLDIANRALERQNNLLNARANLSRAKSDAAITETEIALASVNLALVANQKDFDLLQQKANLETQLVAQRRVALVGDQVVAQAKQQLEIKSNDLASKRLLIEAQLTELKAKQGVLDAQSALQQQRITDQKAIQSAQAELSKANQGVPGASRDRAVADAQSKVSIVQNASVQNQGNAKQSVVLAQQQVGLTQQNTQAVKEQIVNTVEVNRLQKETLTIEQATALKQFDSLELLRLKRIEQEAITKSAREESEIPRVREPVKLPYRRMGGSVTPGQPFVGGEDGLEAVRYGDGSYGWLPSHSVYQVSSPGVVMSANQTAALMGSVSVASLPASVSMSAGGSALLTEIKALRVDISKMKPTINNQFEIVSKDDPYQRMAAIAVAVSRSRW